MSLTPKCIPSHRYVQMPKNEQVSNEVKYYLMQYVDLWKIYCVSNNYHSLIVSYDSDYGKLFQVYLTHCQKLDDLETNFARDIVDWQTVLEQETQGAIQFQTRYTMRIQEVKKYKTMYTKKLLELRIKSLSILAFPLIECMFHLFRIFPKNVFTQSWLNEDHIHVVQHALLWITSNVTPTVSLNKGTVESVINTMEHYIDFRLEKEPERFIIRGVDHFNNQSCNNFFDAIYVMKARREAYNFLLVAYRYRQVDEKRKKVLQSNCLPRLSNECYFFLCNDLVRHTISFLYDDEKCMQPEYFLWM